MIIIQKERATAIAESNHSTSAKKMDKWMEQNCKPSSIKKLEKNDMEFPLKV